MCAQSSLTRGRDLSDTLCHVANVVNVCSKQIQLHFDQERELSDVTDCHVLRHVANVVNVCL